MAASLRLMDSFCGHRLAVRREHASASFSDKKCKKLIKVVKKRLNIRFNTGDRGFKFRRFGRKYCYQTVFSILPKQTRTSPHLTHFALFFAYPKATMKTDMHLRKCLTLGGAYQKDHPGIYAAIGRKNILLAAYIFLSDEVTIARNIL